MARSHHDYALRQYGKALKGVQTAAHGGQKSLRTVLIASILIYCFENFHGNVELALESVKGALTLLRDWLEKTPRLRGAKGLSPAPYEVEDDIIAIYYRLDMTVVSWISTNTASHAESGKLSTPTSTAGGHPPIPKVFSTISEAGVRWELIRHHSSVHLADIHHYPTFNDDGSLYIGPQPLGEIYAWQEAFKPLLQDSRTPTGQGSFVQATQMRIQSVFLVIVATLVYAGGRQSLTASLFHRFLPEFCEIIALCSDLIRHPAFVKSYVLEAGILPVLFVVVTRCGDSMVRQEAVRILKDSRPRREGVWDSVKLSQMADRLLSLEDISNEPDARDCFG
jgi:hypothetical protein